MTLLQSLTVIRQSITKTCYLGIILDAHYPAHYLDGFSLSAFSLIKTIPSVNVFPSSKYREKKQSISSIPVVVSSSPISVATTSLPIIQPQFLKYAAANIPFFAPRSNYVTPQHLYPSTDFSWSCISDVSILLSLTRFYISVT